MPSINVSPTGEQITIDFIKTEDSKVTLHFTLGGSCLLTGNMISSKSEHKDIFQVETGDITFINREVHTSRDNNVTTDSYEIILRNSRYRVDGVKVRGLRDIFINRLNPVGNIDKTVRKPAGMMRVHLNLLCWN